jgi:hypothetical protein
MRLSFTSCTIGCVDHDLRCGFAGIATAMNLKIVRLEINDSGYLSIGGNDE